MLSRRHLLTLTALSGLSTTPLRLAFAAAEMPQRLVVIMLRGAMDGLHAVPPIADRDYRTLRGALALPVPGESGGTLSLDGRFALHPALAAIKQLYDAGEAAIVHAVATPYRDRSHFDGQDLLENGSTRPHGLPDGWLNRTLSLLPGGNERRIGLALGAEIPLVLRGPQDVASWAPDALPEASDDFLERVAAMYVPAPGLSRALGTALETKAMAAGAGIADLGAGNARRQSINLAEVAGRMLSEPNGPRIAVMDVPGWDTHSGQGLAQGRMAQALGQLNAVVAALHRTLSAHWQDTVMLTLTEFGRTAVPNGSGGTDHGTASAAFILGGAVAGGRVVGAWPGLSESQLYQGRDLAPTSDLRSVVLGVLAPHLSLATSALTRTVFPDDTSLAPMPGLLRT
ncbi:DUF1501 domain-containing protein [Dongia mobilis]|uniref:DUF1501 domain-containing protein n=1 Tax=Dongia sp. TaxID=1977262 RepID=UPI0026E97897